jgi:hypothetical protein
MSYMKFSYSTVNTAWKSIHIICKNKVKWNCLALLQQGTGRLWFQSCRWHSKILWNIIILYLLLIIWKSKQCLFYVPCSYDVNCSTMTYKWLTVCLEKYFTDLTHNWSTTVVPVKTTDKSTILVVILWCIQHLNCMTTSQSQEVSDTDHNIPYILLIIIAYNFIFCRHILKRMYIKVALIQMY